MAAVDYRAIAAQAATQAGIDPQIFLAQINAESGFNPNARSPVGATGIAQIMPATARGWGVNPNDPVAALHAAAKAMANYVHSYKGDYRKALAAYNAGPGAVAKYGGVPPYAETQNYVKKILGNKAGWNVPAAGGTPFGQSQGNQAQSSGAGPGAAGGTGGSTSGGNNQAALLMALQGRRPDQSLTNALGNAVLVQRMSNPQQQEPPAQAPVETTNRANPMPGGENFGNYKPAGDYSWANDIAKRYGLRVASTYRDPSHNRAIGGSPTSRHMTRGAATDFSGTPDQMKKLALAAMASGRFSEVFYDPVGQWDNGRRSTKPIGGHTDHVHISLF